ncbi:MAG: imidazole glycerol phosphate synthase subunit HisH [Clostridia bacterium]|nr:imidazole glycerol phosphate synthase subunit HisH [Clostridia bacterium]
MIAIVNYGVGNLYSLKSSFDSLGIKTLVTGDAKEIKKADKIILPGVGAFRDAAASLKNYGLNELIIEEAKKGKAIMGICLGMQMLFEKSYEYGEYEGLGLIKGSVRPIKDVIPSDLKIPHIGWNALKFHGEKSPIFKYIKEGDCVYFVHSYYGADCKDFVIASAEYGAELTAAVSKDNVYGCQFHPEKSGEVGLKILKAFSEI